MLTKALFRKVKKFLPLIGIFILFYIIYNLNVIEIINAFLSISPFFIILSLSLTIPRLIIRNYAWWLIQREQKIEIKYFQSLKIFLIGYFYGSITPGYLGQLMRIPYMKERTGQPYGKLFTNSLIETIVHTISLYAMMFFGALLIIRIFPELILFTVIWIIILSIILIFFINKDRGDKLFNLLIKLFIPKKLKSNFFKFKDSFYHDFLIHIFYSTS